MNNAPHLPMPVNVTLEEIERRFRVAAFMFAQDMPSYMEAINNVQSHLDAYAAMAQAGGGAGLCAGIRNRWAAVREAMLAVSEFQSAMKRYEEVLQSPCPDHGEKHG